MLVVLGKRVDLSQRVRDKAHAEYLMAQPGRCLAHHIVNGIHEVRWTEISTITWALTGDVIQRDAAEGWCSQAGNDGWEVFCFPDCINEEELLQRHQDVKLKLAKRAKP